MSCKNHKHSPEPNRLLICKGYDFAPFTCEGMFIPYKAKKKSRFCLQNKLGQWESARGTWVDVDSWEYAEVKS